MYTILEKEKLYIQLFIYDRLTGKRKQFSCDDITEVDEILRNRLPKFVEMQYFNSFGLVGVAKHYWNFSKLEYVRYFKQANKNNPYHSK